MLTLGPGRRPDSDQADADVVMVGRHPSEAIDAVNDCMLPGLC